MTRVLALVGDHDGCALWRVFLPFTALQEQGYPGIEWGARADDRLAAIAHKFDAVILPRLHWPADQQEGSRKWFDALHKAGLAIIYEVDDDLFSDDFAHRLVTMHDHTPEMAEERRLCILRALQACDGVTVSSQRLASLVRNYTDKPVRVVPNYIDLAWFRKVQKAAQRKVWGLTIGWAGGVRPDGDVALMAEAWARIAAKYPAVKFVIQGHQPQVIYDQVPQERIHALEWLPIEQYPAGLVNVDIGCAPLSDTRFNRCKTYIKAMEYAASGAAVVASPTVYGQIIDDGENGYICRTADEWEAALSRLIEDYPHRRAMSRALLAKVKAAHTLKTEAWRWVEAWSAIVSDYRQRQRRRILIPQGVQYAL